MALDKSKQIAGTLSLGIVLTSGIVPTSYLASTSSVGESYVPVISHTQVNNLLFDREVIAGLSNGDLDADERLWKEMDALFGIWAARDDITDDWLDSLRGRSNDKMTEIYDNEWE